MAQIRANLKIIYLIKKQNVITYHFKQFRVMADRQYSNVIGFGMINELFPYLHLCNRIKHCGNLICNDEFCFGIYCPQYAETLLFPTGKFVRPTSQPLILKAKCIS